MAPDGSNDDGLTCMQRCINADKQRHGSGEEESVFSPEINPIKKK
jgi:hypothetical protein